jgi:hypothetical protein
MTVEVLVDVRDLRVWSEALVFCDLVEVLNQGSVLKCARVPRISGYAHAPIGSHSLCIRLGLIGQISM